MNKEEYEKLKNANERLEKKFAKEQEKIKDELQLVKNQNAILKNKNNDLQSLINIFEKQNKKFFRHYYSKRCKMQDNALCIKLFDVCLDFEYMFYFMKLFEMHIADFMIDYFYSFRLVEALNDFILQRLFADCHSFTNELVKNQTIQTFLKVEQLKQAINNFKKEEALKILLLIRDKNNTDYDIKVRLDNAFEAVRAE